MKAMRSRSYRRVEKLLAECDTPDFEELFDVACRLYDINLIKLLLSASKSVFLPPSLFIKVDDNGFLSRDIHGNPWILDKGAWEKGILIVEFLLENGVNPTVDLIRCAMAYDEPLQKKIMLGMQKQPRKALTYLMGNDGLTDLEMASFFVKRSPPLTNEALTMAFNKGYVPIFEILKGDALWQKKLVMKWFSKTSFGKHLPMDILKGNILPYLGVCHSLYL
jgi:hypothetical protein